MKSLSEHSKYDTIAIYEALQSSVEALISALKLNEIHVKFKRETALQATSQASTPQNKSNRQQNCNKTRTICSNCNREYHKLEKC